MADIRVSNLTVGITSDEAQFAAGADASTNALRRQKQAAKEAGKGLSDYKNKLKDSTAAAKHHASALGKIAAAVKRIAFYRAIRSAIKAVTQATQEGISNLYQYSTALNSLDAAKAKTTMDEFATTALYVKNSIGAALMPVLQSLLPVVNAIADAFIWAANAVNQLVQAVRGSATFTKAKRYATEFGDGLKKASGAAKELKKQVFGFDELNIFNAPSNGGGGGAELPDYSKMFEEAEVAAHWGKLKDLIKTHLAAIEVIVGGALLAVGAILALSGINIPLGIALVAAGAVTLAAGAVLNWNSFGNTIKDKIGFISTIVGGAVLALGAILALSGINIPLGIGLMAAGAIGIAAGLTMNDELRDYVKEKVSEIALLVGGALLFLGAILAFSGNIPLGVGMLVAGAASLATALMMNDTLKEKIKNHLAEITGVVSAALLTLGIITAFTGNLPLGLGLIAAGVIGLAASMYMNDELKKQIQAKFKEIEIILGLSLAGIGAALLFVNPAIGIPLLIGGLGLVADSLDWDALYKKIGEAWEKVKQKGRDIKSDLLGWWESIKTFFKNIVNFNASLKIDTNISKPGQTNAYGFERRASGGEVNTGTFFLAGESGPELVGQVGNKTTVTNQEQFTAGMEDIMDNTNTVIMQAAAALISAIQSKDLSVVVPITGRDIVKAYDTNKRLAGASLVE